MDEVDKVDKKPLKRSLTQKEFIQALELNGGLYSRTARWIELKYGFTISRQAIQKRAQKDKIKAIVDQIKETHLDAAENTVVKLFKSKDDRVKLQSATWYLRKQGKFRGYGDNLDINLGKNVTVIVDDQEPPEWVKDEIDGV